MDLPEGDWLTVTEAAQQLGVHPETLRMAARRGRLTVHRNQSRFTVVSVREVERYRRDHLGKGAWQCRRDPDYQPSPHALAQRRYRERKRAREQAQPAADPPAQEAET